MEIRARAASLGLLAVLASTTALIALPTSPSNLTALVSGTTVTLGWGAASGGIIIGYRLEAGTAPGLSNIASSVIGPVTGFTATAVPNGTYYVRVRAIALDGESPPSNEVIVTVGGSSTTDCSSPPGAPFGLTRSVSGLVVTFSWFAGPGCATTNYVLFAGSTPGASNIAIANVGGLTSFSAAAPAGTYYVRVIGQNAFGSSGASNEVSFAIAASPTPTPTPIPTPIPSPTSSCAPRSAPCGTATAVCRDGTLSCSQNRSGTCSSHDGVACWICPGRLCNP